MKRTRRQKHTKNKEISSETKATDTLKLEPKSKKPKETKSKSNPEVYLTVPEQPKQKLPGQLNDKQLKQYFEKGFVIVEDFFEKEQLDKVRGAVDELVDGLARRLFHAGLIKNKHEDKNFYNRLSFIEKEFKGAAVLLHKRGELPKEVQQLWSDDKLLNVVEQMIGPEIAGHPVWNLRTKTPQNEQTTVPWHQDNAYLSEEALDTLQVTAWIPLIDANMKNGCIEVASGGHRAGKTANHTCCAGGTWYVELEKEEMANELGVNLEKDLVVCEVPYGGVLFMNNAIPHRSLENFSDIIRWSLDLRWQHPDCDNGFWGLKDCVLMRSAKNPDLKIDWTKMVGEDRTWLQMNAVEKDDDQLVPEICGPWMKRWQIVHHNRHTERFKKIGGEGSNYHKA